MNGWRLESALPLGRVCRGLDVGGLAVAAVFEPPCGGAESLSGASLRLAEDLVATLLSTPCAAVRVAGLAPSGRPVARVAGMSSGPAVSVSHVRGLLGAAASTDGQVGLDIVDPAAAGRALDAFFTPDELTLMPDDMGLLRALLWGAKEAAYKAARLDTEFRPRRVTIESLSPNGFSWVVRERHAVVTGVGRFATVGRYVVAIAATAPVTRHDRAVVRAIISTWWGVAVPSAVSSPDVFTRPWLIDARRPGPSAPSLQECPA